MKRINRLLDATSEARIRSAIREAERKTSAEIVPMIVWESSPTFHVFPMLLLTLGMLIGFLAPFIVQLLGEALPAWLIHAILVFSGLFIAYGLSRISAVQRALTPDDFELQMVERRALFEFYQSQMDQTIAKTGVLIFVSVRERRAVVLSDKTISDHVKPEVWTRVVETLTVTAHRTNMTEGLVAAVEKAGELLEHQFPRGPHDINELPDKLLIKL